MKEFDEYRISVSVMREAGFNEAMTGITLSHGATRSRAEEIAPKLAHKGSGHGKFLESILVWLDVTAPRYWWMQADTYRMSTKQSESTMHTICKRPLTQMDFAKTLPEGWLETINGLIELKRLDLVKMVLPESFLQRRIWCVSYKTLQNIVAQRNAHKLLEWRDFCDAVIDGVEYPEFIGQTFNTLEETK